MSKKVINQNTNNSFELLNSIGSDFIFDENPISRFKDTSNNSTSGSKGIKVNKEKNLLELKDRINSIEDCNLKNNSRNIVFGDGNINSAIMLIGEAPGEQEDKLGLTFTAEAGDSFSSVEITGTTEGEPGSMFKLTCIAADVWFIEGVILSAGTSATPFATS